MAKDYRVPERWTNWLRVNAERYIAEGDDPVAAWDAAFRRAEYSPWQVDHLMRQCLKGKFASNGEEALADLFAAIGSDGEEAFRKRAVSLSHCR